MRGRLTFPPQRRLRRKAEFEAAYAGGRRLGNGLFGVTARPNDLDGPRLGLAVALRVCGTGVERNRLRRAIRESFRLHQGQLPALDLVVSARSGARGVSGPELQRALADLWEQVKARCDISSRS